MAKGKKLVDAMISGVKTPAQMKAEMAVDRARNVLPQANPFDTSHFDSTIIQRAKKDFGDTGKLSDEEYQKALAERANQYRIESILSGQGFDTSGYSNLSGSSYHNKIVGTEYDPKYGWVEQDTHQVRLANHPDYHPPMAEDVKQRFNINHAVEPSTWEDYHISPSMTDEQVNEILSGLNIPNEPDITKAHGGAVHMAGGGLGRKLGNLLPKAERDINLGNMLKESAVKDRLYHGTSSDFSEFKYDPQSFGIWMAKNPEFASIYSHYKVSNGNNPNVMPLYSSLKNPATAAQFYKAKELAESEPNISKELINQRSREILQEQGFDGVDMGDAYVAFDPSKVKSAIGNEGTYDITNPDITKADGGVVKMSKGGVGRKLADIMLPKVEAPSVMTRSELTELADYIKNREGGYGLRRVERAADEIPRLGEMYTQDALRSAFSGDNARALMTMNPADFERYSAPLLTDLSQSSKDNIANLKAIQKVGGFNDVPFFLVNKELAGSTGLPWITGHEGRHRSRAMNEAGVQSGLVQFVPRAELREPFPRRSQEQYIEAIRKEMELSGNKIKPEKYYLQETDEKTFQRPTIDLPDLYANGGAVKMAEGGELDRAFYDQLRKQFSVKNKPEETYRTPYDSDVHDRTTQRFDSYRQIKENPNAVPSLDQQRLELMNAPVIQATPQTMMQFGLGTIGGYMDKAGDFINKAVEPIAESNPVKTFIAELFGDSFKGAGTALQDYTKTSRDYTEDNPYKRAPITGSGQTMSLDPRMLDVIGFADPVTRLGIKAGRAGAKAATPFAKDVGAMASEMYMRGDVPGMVSPNAYVIKPKGGNWLGGGIDAGIDRLKVPLNDRMISGEMINEMAGEDLWSKIVSDGKQGSARSWLHSNRPDVFDKIYGRESMPINKWIDTKLKKYVQNELATPEDPIRALATKGVSHMSDDALDTSNNWVPDDLGFKRRAAGFPEENMADIDYREALAKSIIGEGAEPDAATADAYRRAGGWESIADASIYNSPASRWLDRKNEVGFASVIKDNPFLEKAPPETRFNTVSESATFAEDLGFDHIVDELKNAMRIDSDLPEKLRIEPSKLEKMTVPQVVERVSEINKWRAENQAAANQKLAMNPATQVVKEYPDQGYKWVELKTPSSLPEKFTVTEQNGRFNVVDATTGDPLLLGRSQTLTNFNTPEEAVSAYYKQNPSALEDALKYEGDTMGHCVGGYCPDVMSGETRIYSLRDSKGEPHVTIEVQPNQNPYPVRGEEFLKLSPAQKAEFREHVMQWRRRNPDVEELTDDNINEALRDAGVPPRPDSIIQIKGKGNAKPKDSYLPFVQDFVKGGEWSEVRDFKNTGLIKEGDQMMTPAEHANWLEKQLTPPPDSMKRGGKVSFANDIDAMRLELSKG